jgi:PDZ domain-containing secreted protein
MKLDLYVNDAKIEQAIRVKGIFKINLTVDVSLDDIYDFAEQFVKLKKSEFENLKEFINALEKEENNHG